MLCHCWKDFITLRKFWVLIYCTQKFLRTVTLCSSSVIWKEHQDRCSDRENHKLVNSRECDSEGQNHKYDMGLKQMLRWFWEQSMSWKVRLVEEWQDCTGAQFIKELKPGGSCIHRLVWVDSVILLGPHLIMPGQNFLALWEGAHTCKGSNGLGKQTCPKWQNCHWKPRSQRGPAFGDLLGKAYADLGSGLTPAPERGVTWWCRGTAHATAGSWQAEDALHLQHKALPSNSKGNGSTPLDCMCISCDFNRLLHRENTLHMAE